MKPGKYLPPPTCRCHRPILKEAKRHTFINSKSVGFKIKCEKCGLLWGWTGYKMAKSYKLRITECM